MRTLPVVLTSLVFSTSLLPAHSVEAQAGYSLGAHLQSRGFGGAQLRRVGTNLLSVPIVLNGRKTEWIVDTGATHCTINRTVAPQFGMKEAATGIGVVGAFGASGDKVGVSMAQTLGMGNCVLKNVPVAVVNAGDMYAHWGNRALRLDGFLGAREMRRFGMVIDCARQMMFVNPAGEKGGGLDALLPAQGFIRVPIRYEGNEFLVDGAVNGTPARFIIDTGSFVTMLSRSFAKAADLKPSDPRYYSKGIGTREAGVSIATLKNFRIGGVEYSNLDVGVTSLSSQIAGPKVGLAGLIGGEYLALKFGIVDCGGLALYLRP